jgi:glycosyltransferase involved in cell wall biosynthesis
MWLELRKKISEFDIVHLHSVFLWPTWAAASLAKSNGVPYIISPRGMLVGNLIQRKSRLIKSTWIRLIEKRNIRHANAVHVTSPVEQEEIQKLNLQLPELALVPNGVSPYEEPTIALCRKDIQGIVKGRPYLLFISRINWKKGLDRLLQAVKLIPDIDLVIAGNDEENYSAELKALAKKIGIEQRTRFLGPVYGNDKAALLKNAALLTLPSYSENFGNIVLEAMAASLPVAVTPEVGLAHAVKENACGIVAPGDASVFSKQITEALNNPNMLETMGNNGKTAFDRLFTWNAVSGQMESVYIEAMNTIESNQQVG